MCHTVDTVYINVLYFPCCQQQANDIIPNEENEMNNEKKKVAKPERLSMRSLARALKRSPSHICRVMNGSRVSATLARRLKAMGVEVA